MVTADFDVGLGFTTVVERVNNVTITTRVLIHNVFDQILEICCVSIYNCAYAKPTSSRICRNDPYF